MVRISVQTADFDVSAEMAALTAGRGDIGGIGCFVGTVRDNTSVGTVRDNTSVGTVRDNAPNAVTGMTLEHYPGMTERSIARIVQDAEARWPLKGVTVIHRVGPLCTDDNIVLVIAASAHRQAALDATAFLIDWLKTKAPFWKPDDFAGGEGAWVDAREEDDAAAARWLAG